MYIGRFHKYKVAGICLAGIHDDHITYLINTLTTALNEQGFKTLVFNAFSDFHNETPYTKGEESVYQLINYQLIDVLIVFPETIKNDRVVNDIINGAKEHKLPIITVDREVKGCTNVLYDYKGGFEEIVRHVIEKHNITDPFMIAGLKNNSFSDERVEVYKKVLAEKGIEFREDRFGYGGFWGGPTRDILENMISTNTSMPQAFICANDSMAIACARFLRERGYRVPEDIIVSGFDATFQENIYTLSAITTALIDLTAMSKVIAETAQGYFDKTEIPCNKIIPYSLKLAQSCGCVKEIRDLDGEFQRINDYNFAALSHEAHISLFTTNTVGCKSLTEISDAMTKFTGRQSWVCIKNNLLDKPEDVVDNGKLFTDNMLSLIHRDGEEVEKNITYKQTDLLPDIGRVLKKYNKLLIVPLNFLSEVLGYYVVVTDWWRTGFNYYHDARRFSSAANHILQNFRVNYSLQKAYDRLEMTQEVDPLTHMLNRKGYFAQAQQLLLKNRGKYLMMMSADMDNLKEINDNYGHDEGDFAIKAMADIVKNACNPNGICARFGGDEFVITEPCEDPRVFSARKAELIQEAVDNYNSKTDKPYRATMSIGIVYGTVNTVDELSELIRRADNMMYEQKHVKKERAFMKLKAENTGKAPMSHSEQRIHEIFSKFSKTTYFYMDYVNLKWHIMPSESTPECIVSNTVSPIRALWTSGDVFEDDRAILFELITKIKIGFERKVDQPHHCIHIRIMKDGKPVWYQLVIIMEADNTGKMSELVGFLQEDSPEEIMKMELENYYTTTENPLMINDQIKTLINNAGGKKCAIIHFDIKRFKFINEKYGEEYGTELLYNINRKLKMYCNSEQLSARLTSDIFMFMTTYNEIDDIYNIIYDIEDRMRDFRDIHYDFAFGVYLIDDPTLEPRLMGDRASIARNSIKGSAIDNIAFYDKQMLQRAENRRFVESNMNKALENQEFIIYLQPKFSISRKEAVGYEALVRWIHPERGLISPADFIPLFEENGFITRLDAYVWECACQVLHDWMDRGFEALPISVNVSRMHLKDEDFLDILDGLIEKYQIPKNLLELEITESVDSSETNIMTKVIKDRGYILLMDDFGSGYSSLNTLKSTRFDVLKIDREFLSSFMTDERGKKIISHTISMSQDVGLDLIAEGVETEEQARFLSECGCDVAQGFFYARPMPVQDAEEFLTKIREDEPEDLTRYLR